VRREPAYWCSLGDAVLAPRSLDAVDLGAVELGLLCYLDVPTPHASWRLVEGSMEQTYS
jgi:hypothetical protein